MTIRAAISCYSADHVNPNGRIVASDYVDILGNQVHLVVQMLFPNTEATFQDDNSAILTARSVQSWFKEHEDALRQLPRPAQTPDLKRTNHASSTNVSNATTHNTYEYK